MAATGSVLPESHTMPFGFVCNCSQKLKVKKPYIRFLVFTQGSHSIGFIPLWHLFHAKHYLSFIFPITSTVIYAHFSQTVRDCVSM